MERILRKLLPTLLLAALTLFLAVGLLLPAARLGAELFAGSALGSLLTAYNIRAFTNTLTMGLAVGLAATATGFAVALHIVTTRGTTSTLARALFPAALLRRRSCPPSVSFTSSAITVF